ncbi:EAL domain-containing protein [Oceanospirillum sanctuarii]|uniref:EAL domain-containing protein n=1 Tax=Oceanospirillum sanctuarii TaxID=1434821 RepID=UPI001594170D|nr:EAL domain-containing protein [Oceanospirillum sanctuarii]
MNNTLQTQLSRQYSHTLVWILVLFALCFFLIGLSVWGAAKAVDKEDIHHTEATIIESLRQEKSLLEAQLRDYAIWDEAYQLWVVDGFANDDWISSNFGLSLYENLDIAWSAITDQNRKLLLSSYEGIPTRIPPDIEAFQEKLYQLDQNASGLFLINNELWLLGSHPVQPENEHQLPKVSPRAFVFGKRIANSVIRVLKIHTDTAQAFASPQPIQDMASFAVRDQLGQTLSYINWNPAHPGTALLHRLMPDVTALLLILTLATYLLIRRIMRQGRHSLSEMQALARTRQDLGQQQIALQKLRQQFQGQHTQEGFLQELIMEAGHLTSADITSVWLLDASGEHLTCQASNASMKGSQLLMKEMSATLNQLQQRPVTLIEIPHTRHLIQENHSQSLIGFFQDHKVSSLLVTAIYLGGELRGILTLGSQHARNWSDSDHYACSAFAGVVAQFGESFQRQTMEEDLYQQTHFDDITGLPRLTYIEDEYPDLLSEKQGFLVVLRIQGLHIINELHGFDSGNDIFRQFSQCLMQKLEAWSPEGLLVRLPANRLGLFIEGEESRITGFLEQLIRQLESKHWVVQRKSYTLKLQMGLSRYPEDGQDPETLQHRAKLALQHVRSTPGLSYAVYSQDVSTGLKARNEAISDLERGIKNEEFELFFQPQFNCDRKLISAEALVRWRHPERGLLSPAHFIELAEETELILPLGRWILHRACQLLQWHTIRLSVNISVLQMKQKDFVEEIATLLQRYQFSPDQLTLEVVESLMMDQEVKGKLSQIRELGVEISLDDFGTGYSSLSYLQDLPVDELKVDQSFIQALEHHEDAPLVRTIIAMAHTLNMRVVVEGVETDEQFNFVSEQKAELIQGYLLAKPEPWDHFVGRLNLPTVKPNSKRVPTSD